MCIKLSKLGVNLLSDMSHYLNFSMSTMYQAVGYVFED